MVFLAILCQIMPFCDIFGQFMPSLAILCHLTWHKIFYAGKKPTLGTCTVTLLPGIASVQAQADPSSGPGPVSAQGRRKVFWDGVSKVIFNSFLSMQHHHRANVKFRLSWGQAVPADPPPPPPVSLPSQRFSLLPCHKIRLDVDPVPVPAQAQTLTPSLS